MSEEMEIWLMQPDQLKQFDINSSIISFSKGIPLVQLDYSTLGTASPQICVGGGNSSNGIIPISTQMNNPLKYKENRSKLIDEMDQLHHINMPDPNWIHCKQLDIDFREFIQYTESAKPPGIESSPYSNRDLFTGEIISVGTAYMSAEVKKFDPADVAGKHLTKLKLGPEQISIGDRFLTFETITESVHKQGLEFEQRAKQIQLQRNLRHMQHFQEYCERIPNISEQFIKAQVEAITFNYTNGQDQDFEDLWNEKIHQEQRDNPEKSIQQDDQIYVENDLETITQSDLEVISDMNELSKQAQETAKIQNVEENSQNDPVSILKEIPSEGDPVLLDEQFFAERTHIAIQEENPVIKAQIEAALAVQTKFKIIRANDIDSNQQALKFDKQLKFAVEDDSDMSNFYDYLPKAKMAKQYSFELDDFQKRSLLHLERKQSIFVCAHTSAGKTVVAEYAIALAFKHNRRAIYTSPIKALSNQKYREFDTKFGNTGVVTGDVSINPGAGCLILTTEILRNMLYRKAELIRDIEWVIFDEVHYVNDQERGMVWEETIIMLPPHIGIIMLSATVPNYMDFANWVGRTRKEIIYVMKTFTRPVPLVHYLYIFDKFHAIKEKDEGFLYSEYSHLKKQIKDAEDEKKGIKERIKKNMDDKKEDETYNYKNKTEKMAKKNLKSKFIQSVNSNSMRGKDEKRALGQLIRLCEKKDLLPCVIFVFSRKKINELAAGFIKQKLRLIDHKTESRILTFFDQSLQKLKPQDRKSPQLLRLRDVLRFGIAIHHGHLLPIAKEIVEILFSEGLIKVLLATETFAMGINMPTKTVIFHSIEKFDGGQSSRMLHSSEYTQMSGRAGRRGLDERGNVIIFIRDPQQLPDEFTMKKMVDAPGQQLESKFKITYRIILNLITIKDLDATEMMKRSFHENNRFIQLPKYIQQLDRLKKDYIKSSSLDCPYQKGIRSGIRKQLIEEYREVVMTFKFQQIEFMGKILERNKAPNLPRYALFTDHNGDLSLGIILTLDRPRGGYSNPYYLQPEALVSYKMSVMTVHSQIEDPDIQFRYRKLKLEYQLSTKRVSKQLKSNGQFLYVINEIGEDCLIDFLEETPKQASKTQFASSDDNQFEEYATQLLDKQKAFSSYRAMVDAIYQQVQAKGRALNKMKYRIQKTQQEKQYEQEQQFIGEDEDPQQSAQKYRNQQIKELMDQQCNFCDLKEKHLSQLLEKEKIKENISELRLKINGNDRQYQNDFENKLNVLKFMGYIDQNGLPLIKARIARELTDQSSIYVCELLVDNVLETLDPAEIASLLCGFICQDRSKRNEEEVNHYNLEHWIHHKFDEISMELSGAMLETYTIIRKILVEEQRLDALDGLDPEDIIKSVLNYNLTQIIYSWAKGQSFVDVCLQTDIEEGSIVRTIQRLENMLRGVSNAYKVMGNLKMVDKIDKSCLAIKKDIVFAESLYFDPNAKFDRSQIK